MSSRPVTLHKPRHRAQCDCAECLARQAGFDRFIALVGLAAFLTVAAGGFVQLYRSGLLSW